MGLAGRQAGPYPECRRCRPFFHRLAGIRLFVFAGRLAPEKGITTLIRAAASAGKRLIIAGTGPDEADLKALATSLDAPVTFVGHLSGDALFSLIGRSKALVLPSEWYENAPISVLEAYALGRPVIGAAIGGIPELIRENETGMTSVAGSIESLAATLSAMDQRSPAERRDMGLTGRAWIANDFSRDVYRQKMAELYRAIGA